MEPTSVIGIVWMAGSRWGSACGALIGALLGVGYGVAWGTPGIGDIGPLAGLMAVGALFGAAVGLMIGCPVGLVAGILLSFLLQRVESPRIAAAVTIAAVLALIAVMPSLLFGGLDRQDLVTVVVFPLIAAIPLTVTVLRVARRQARTEQDA